MNCKECVFATWNDDAQSGCSVNRLSKLKELDKANVVTEDNLSYYELTRFCNLYRTEEWKEKQERFDEDLITIVLKEVKPKFGIAVYDEKDNLGDLDKTLNSIKNINYDPKCIKVVISSFKERGVQELVSKVITMQEQGFECIMSLHTYNDDIYLRDTECFSKMYRNSYFVKINVGSTIDKDFFNTIEKSLNQDLEQGVLFEDSDNQVHAVHFQVANQEYLNYNNFDLMIQNLIDNLYSPTPETNDNYLQHDK